MKCVMAVLCSAVTWQAAYAAQPEHSTSPSRQFVIYGADAKVRGAISGLAEQTKTNLLGLMRQRDDWKTPVVVNLQSQQSNLPELPPADLRFSQTGFGIKLQLDLTISKSVDVSLVERELLRAILLEMVYRNQPHITAGAVLVEPPDWLIDGALALAPGRERGPLIEAIVNTEKPLPLEKFLRQRPGLLDSIGPHALPRICFCASANAAGREKRRSAVGEIHRSSSTTLQMIRSRISRRNFRYSRMTPRERGSWR